MVLERWMNAFLIAVLKWSMDLTNIADITCLIFFQMNFIGLRSGEYGEWNANVSSSSIVLVIVLVHKTWLYVRDCEQFLAINLNNYTLYLCCGWDKSSISFNWGYIYINVYDWVKTCCKNTGINYYSTKIELNFSKKYVLRLEKYIGLSSMQ